MPVQVIKHGVFHRIVDATLALSHFGNQNRQSSLYIGIV